MAAKAVEVIEHVVLVLVDVPALPEAVAPLGEKLGKAGEAGRTGAAAPRASTRTAARARAARRVPASRSRRARRRARTASRSRTSSPRPHSRGSRAATASARSRPAGCRRRRASPAGSLGRCIGGRHRAGRSARPDRTGCSDGRRGRRSAPRSAGPSRSRAAAAVRQPSATSKMRSSAGRAIRSRAARPPSITKPEHDALIVFAGDQVRSPRPLNRRDILVGDDPLGELHEMCRGPGTFGDPHPRAHAAAGAPRRRTVNENGRSATSTRIAPRVSSSSSAVVETLVGTPDTFSDERPTPSTRLLNGHKTTAPSSRTPSFAGRFS